MDKEKAVNFRTINRIDTDIAKLNKRTKNLESLFKAIDKHKTGELLTELNNDISEIKNKVKIDFIKTITATELRFVFNDNQEKLVKILSGVIKAFDYPDTFWINIKNITLDELGEIFIDIDNKKEVVNVKRLLSHPD